MGKRERRKETASQAKRVLYFIDTNIFIYASGSSHPYKRHCLKLLNSVAIGETRAAVSVEVVQELLHYHSSRNRRTTGLELARQAMEIFHPALPVMEEDMRLAVHLAEIYPDISSRDSVHAAVALNNGIGRIISTDRDFDSVREITRLDPSAFA